MSASDRVKDWGLNAAIVLAGTLALCMVALTIATLVQTNRAANETAVIRAMTEAAACRDLSRIEVDTARANMAEAQAELIVVATMIQTADAIGDTQGAAAALASMPAAQSNARSAIDALGVAIDGHQAALERSRSDPAGFLAACREG